MKNNICFRKYICTGLAAVCLLMPFYAQDAGDSQIELPDLTTVVTGDSAPEDLAPPPSFDDVLELPMDSGDLVPSLPSVSADDESEVVAAGNQANKKDIYAEGKIGGGYPVSFKGDFVVSRLYGADPFQISFAHDSKAGYAGHELSDGYKSSFTSIQVQKDFIRNNIEWGISGCYEDNSDGLQGKAEGISANVQDAVALAGKLTWNLPKNFQLGFNLDSKYYFRFADITKSADPAFAVSDWIKKTEHLTVDPTLTIGWLYNGFELSFDAAYNMETGKKIANRGQFDLNFAWANEKIKVYADAGIVCGNYTCDNKVTVPFEVGLDTSFPVYFSDRKLNLSLCGGIKSERKTTQELEKEYKFSVLEDLAAETSDWFGQINLLVPLKSSFTGNVSAGYLRTAFGNGYWVPDYSIVNPQNGLYGYGDTGHNRNCLYTDFSFTWKFKIFAATAGYHANWLDVPVLENKHTISLDLSLQSQKGSWGASLNTAYLLDAADNKPLINIEGYMQASDAVRIVLSVNDLIKLLGAEERAYAGQYAGYSGNAMLLVKFLF
ncbi:MAG: hypothetical protein IK102_11700 [Treponema sp.]|nr:hypothetical protein [Treponema sp.]